MVDVGSAIVGIFGFVVVLAIVLMLAVSYVSAFTPELLMFLFAIITVIAVVAITLMALAYKNRD